MSYMLCSYPWQDVDVMRVYGICNLYYLCPRAVGASRLWGFRAMLIGVPHETRGSRFSTIIGFILCRGLELLYIAACLSVYWGATFMGLLFNFISSHDGAISIDCTIRLPAFSLLKLSGFYCQDRNNIDYVLIIYL